MASSAERARPVHTSHEAMDEALRENPRAQQTSVGRSGAKASIAETACCSWSPVGVVRSNIATFRTAAPRAGIVSSALTLTIERKDFGLRSNQPGARLSQTPSAISIAAGLDRVHQRELTHAAAAYGASNGAIRNMPGQSAA